MGQSQSELRVKIKNRGELLLDVCTTEDFVRVSLHPDRENFARRTSSPEQFADAKGSTYIVPNCSSAELVEFLNDCYLSGAEAEDILNALETRLGARLVQSTLKRVWTYVQAFVAIAGGVVGIVGGVKLLTQ